MGLLLFIIADVFLFPFTIVNYFYVENKKGYFRSTARNIDIFANKEYRAFWNSVLITKDGYKFGKEGETLSSVLGKNQLLETLKPKGMFAVKLLNKIEKNHCILAIEN